MKRLLIVLAVVGAGLTGLVTQHAVLADLGGSAAAAHACQQGGYANLLGTDGTTVVTFDTIGECVSYAAHGGTLISVSDAAPCLNGSYSGQTTSNATASFAGSGTAAFRNEAACVLYVGQGGHPVSVPQPSVSGIIWGS